MRPAHAGEVARLKYALSLECTARHKLERDNALLLAILETVKGHRGCDPQLCYISAALDAWDTREGS